MSGEDRTQLLLSNEYYDCCSKEDNGEYRNTLLKSNEFKDAINWEIEDLIASMSKLVI